jgi:hypothetical protein
MPTRLILTLRADSSPHLSVEKLVELIKTGKTLHPKMQQILNVVRQHNLQFIILPLEMEIILSWEKAVTLERSLRPSLNAFTKTDWTDEDKVNFAKDNVGFTKEILQTYALMGYEVREDPNINVEQIQSIIETVNKDEKKAKTTIARIQKVQGVFKRGK